MSEDVFRWVVAVGVFLACASAVTQAIIMAALYRAGRRAAEAGKEAQGKFGPLLERLESVLVSSSKLLEENRSRISEITADMAVLVHTTRQQAVRAGELLDDANTRAKARIAQIDETVDRTVVQVEQAREAVRTAVMKPVVEVNGFVAGVKAAVSTYARGGNRNTPEHVTQDEEMFI